MKVKEYLKFESKQKTHKISISINVPKTMDEMVRFEAS